LPVAVSRSRQVHLALELIAFLQLQTRLGAHLRASAIWFWSPKSMWSNTACNRTKAD
jgi:hypothetical protein